MMTIKKPVGFMLGMEKPFNLHQWAKKKGYIDNEGNLYYDEYRTNKLPDYEWQAKSYWMTKYLDYYYNYVTIFLCGEAVKQYPLFRSTILTVHNRRKSNGTDDIKMFEPPLPFEQKYVDFEKISKDLQGTQYDKIVDDPEDIVNNWGIIKRKMTKIEVFKSGKRRLITDDGLEIWFPENMRIDVIPYSDIYLVISAYIRKNSSLGINGLGYWTEEKYRLW